MKAVHDRQIEFFRERLEEVRGSILDERFHTLVQVPHKYCQVPEKLNIKVRINKEPLADYARWHRDQETADAIPHVVAAGYKN